MMKPRISVFAEQERQDWRAKLGDPLVGLAEHVDFEALARINAFLTQQGADFAARHAGVSSGQDAQLF